MKDIFLGIVLIGLLFILLSFRNTSIDLPTNKIEIEWFPAKLLNEEGNSIIILGNPQICSSKYGNAVQFNGINDAIFLDEMPLEGLKQFTIEVIFFPESESKFEQRFLHYGEVKGSRVLLELRAIEDYWYFDAYVNSDNEDKALIDSNLIHPLDNWYHLAYVVDNGLLSTYINGVKELESAIKFSPIQSGKTSIGVRQNEVSWFKGKIYKIRISNTALKENEFLAY